MGLRQLCVAVWQRGGRQCRAPSPVWWRREASGRFPHPEGCPDVSLPTAVIEEAAQKALTKPNLTKAELKVCANGNEFSTRSNSWTQPLEPGGSGDRWPKAWPLQAWLSKVIRDASCQLHGMQQRRSHFCRARISGLRQPSPWVPEGAGGRAGALQPAGLGLFSSHEPTREQLWGKPRLAVPVRLTLHLRNGGRRLLHVL